MPRLAPSCLVFPALLAVLAVGASAQGIAQLERQAQAGNAAAQYKLAEAYYQGDGVAADPAEGLMWLQKSATKGYSKAEFRLADNYRTGRGGTAKDDRQAFYWFRKAAEHGNPTAQAIVGINYKYGESGAPRDVHEAARWFRLAARQRDADARDNLLELFKEGQITEQEANWQRAESHPKSDPTPATAKPFSLSEVEKGLRGGITPKRLATLIKQFGVNFSVTASIRQRLVQDGADGELIAAIAESRPAH
jgi:TPR repeat protein